MEENNQGFSLTDTINKAILDCKCSRAICGSDWFKVYTDSLNELQRSKIIVYSSNSLFKFGDSSVIKTIKRIELLITIADVEIMLTIDNIDRDILSLSKESMKKADIQINFEQNKVTLFVNDVPLEINSSWHYYITIKPSKLPQKDFEMILISDINKNDTCKKNVATKLNRQFANARSYKTKALLSDFKIQVREVSEHLDTLDSTCNICMKNNKKKPKPIVGLPLPRTFSETVDMDLE